MHLSLDKAISLLAQGVELALQLVQLRGAASKPGLCCSSLLLGSVGQPGLQLSKALCTLVLGLPSCHLMPGQHLLHNDNGPCVSAALSAALQQTCTRPLPELCS